MGKFGFALGTLAGMAINAANARERRACDLNEMGIKLANKSRYEEALNYLLEANKLLPNNEYIQNNIIICREALVESRNLLKKQNNDYTSQSYTQSTAHEVKITKSSSIKYYPTLQDIPDDLLTIFLKEKNLYFDSKSDLIYHSNKYWSKKEVEDFIKEVEFFEDVTPDLITKIEELKFSRFQQGDEKEYQSKKQELEQNIQFQRIQQSKNDYEKFIIDNMDEVCRIYSIPKLSKKYVVNQIIDNYSPLDVWVTLERYK